MSVQNHFEESLSALMDDEVDEMEMHRILKQVSENPALREKWHRYQLARAVLHSEMPDFAIDVSQNVREAIGNDRSARNSRRHIKRAMKPFGRMAVAASVAALAVLGVQQYQLLAANSGVENRVVTEAVPVQDDEVLNSPLPPGFVMPRVNTRTVSAGSRPTTHNTPHVRVIMDDKTMRDRARDLEVQSYLNELMLRHAEHAALNTNQGMLPFARVSQPGHGK